jgi:hypothetical protein
VYGFIWGGWSIEIRNCIAPESSKFGNGKPGESLTKNGTWISMLQKRKEAEFNSTPSQDTPKKEMSQESNTWIRGGLFAPKKERDGRVGNSTWIAHKKRVKI